MTDPKSVKTKDGLKIMLNRSYKSVPDFTVPSQIRIGADNAEPFKTDSDIDIPIPISDGTVLDNGDNQLTGSNGGTNTTDNSTTFKQGANETDDKAQNLIANDTNATKTWTIADLSALGTNATGTSPFGLWLYIKDAAALAKFKTTGTCLEIKLGSGASDYYSKTFEVSDLATGWNWLTSNFVNVEDMTETGTVAGNLDTFIIEITTNNATDEFAAGDVVYDLLRQWTDSDLVKDIISGYPSFNYTDMEVTILGKVLSTEMNGFNFNAASLINTDGTALVSDIDVFSDDSKANTDEFDFEFVNKLEQG